MSELYVYPKSGEPYPFAINKASVTIGRSPDNDLPLADPCCSNRHAVVIVSEKTFTLKDMGSKNGTFVNGKQILADTVLKSGDEILVGATRIVFNRKQAGRFEVVEGTAITQYSNTVIGVRDILKKPVLDKTPKDRSVSTDVDKLRHDQEVLSVLNEVSQALIHHFPLDQLLDFIMDLITRYIAMDRGVLLLREGVDGDLQPKVIRVLNAHLRDHSIQLSRSILNTALGQNSSVLVSDIQADPHFSAQASVIQTRIQSAMCVPLWNNQEIIGAVYADRIQGFNRFTEDDLKLMTLLANLAAVKIENAKLFEEALEKIRLERDLTLASEIQKNFLPKENPACKGYEICGSNRTCCHVGGDYYDFIGIDSSRLGIVTADVSGTGVSASLLMASLRAALHAEVHAGYDLAVSAYKLNDFVYRSSDSHNFITFAFCELNTSTSDVTYVNAGHNPPLRLKLDGEIERLESNGLCLGMFPGTTYDTGRTHLAPGELLCLYTDGITESRNQEKEEFGEEGLIDLLRRLKHLPAQDILDKIFESVLSFSTCADVQDDMTLVVIKRTSEDTDLGKTRNVESQGFESRELKVPADLSQVDKIRGVLKESLSPLKLSEEEYYKIELSLHEICVNIIRYAYPEIPGDIALKISLSGNKIFLEIRDTGVPFNPNLSLEPDLSDKIRTGERGGLGIFLARRLMDEFSYSRENDENILTLSKTV